MVRRSLSAEEIPPPVIELCRVFAKHGRRAWIVGGCLRDLLREKPAADWDLATDARPQETQGMFPKVIATGIQHGTVTVRHRGHSYEVTTLRGEGAYSDGRRPDTVEFVNQIEADLARRDFTVNAMAYDPLRSELSDPFGGIADLERGVLRAVGDPLQRFSEDGLRVLRAARFTATLGLAIEPATEAAIAPTLPTFAKVSAERVRDEWLKALAAPQPARAFRVMKRTGILGISCPLLEGLTPAELEVGLSCVDGLPRDPILRLAGLLSALGPERSADRSVGEWLSSYRFSNAERERIVRLLRDRPSTLELTASDALVRRYASRVGRAWVFEIAGFARAVAQHSGQTELADQLAVWTGRLETLVTSAVPLSTKELAVTGSDLMAELALAPGPILGRLLEFLLERVLESPELNTRLALLELARGRLAEAR